jgi:hypothetical protein
MIAWARLSLLGASESRPLRDFAEVIRLASSNIELNVTDLKVRGTLEDSCSQLEEGQQELLLN